jgi:hypothetical protein
MTTGKYIAVAFFLFPSLAAFSQEPPGIVVSNGHADVTTPTGKKQRISVNGTASLSDAKFVDLTFNGYADLLIRRDRGSNQEFYDVYLYSKDRDAYVYSNRLSDIPCLAVGSKRKELVGQCFHESACENWEEHYSVSTKGSVSLVERKGAYCDPASGQGFLYTDRFRNGKKISSKISRITEQPGN